LAIIFSFKVRGLTLVYKAFVWFFIRHLPTGIPFCSLRSKFQATLLSELPLKHQYWRDRKFKMNTIFYKVHVWHWSENVTFHGKVPRLTNDGTKTCEMNFDNLNKSPTCNDISSQLFCVFPITSSTLRTAVVVIIWKLGVTSTYVIMARCAWAIYCCLSPNEQSVSYIRMTALFHTNILGWIFIVPSG
jgi:hypothetical protein